VARSKPPMKETCKDCKNTKCEQIREDVVLKKIAGKSPELFVGTIQKCPLKKKEEYHGEGIA